MKNKKQEVYCISGFKDTLASPVFYPVIVVTIVLGLTSIFGFVQNPMKLKAVADLIHQKVAVDVVSDKRMQNIQVKSDIFDASITSDLLLDFTFQNRKDEEKSAPEIFDIFSDIDTKIPEKIAINADFERVAFNYDVTSEQFWTNLDSSKLESASEEAERQDREASVFGIPLEVDYRESLGQELDKKDIYAINQNTQSKI